MIRGCDLTNLCKLPVVSGVFPFFFEIYFLFSAFIFFYFFAFNIYLPVLLD